MASFTKKIALLSQSASLFRDENLLSCGMSGYQAKYVLEVFNNEGISQDALAKTLMVNKSNVARQVCALESSGFIRREQSAEDKRVMLLYTTEKGKQMVPVIREANARWRDILCRGMEKNRQDELSALLDIMVENAREYLYKRQ